MSVHEDIRRHRTAATMTQAHLAQAAGVSERTVIRAEQGRTVSAESLRALGAVLGLDVTSPPAAAAAPASFEDRVAALGGRVTWSGAPDVASWRERNAFLGWGAMAAVLSAGLLATVVGGVTGAVLDPSSVADDLGLALAAGACQAYVAHRVMTYVRRHRDLARTVYATTTDALWVQHESHDGGERTVTRHALLPGAVPDVVSPYALWKRVLAVELPVARGRFRIEGLGAAGTRTLSDAMSGVRP